MEETGAEVTGSCKGEGGGGGDVCDVGRGVKSKHKEEATPNKKPLSVEEEFRARRREEKKRYSNIPQRYHGYEALLNEEEEEEEEEEDRLVPQG